MKKYFVFFVCIFLVFIGCDTEVEPIGKFEQKHVLVGILKPDTSLQLINLSRSYSETSSDSLDNLPIKNADVKVWFDEEIRRFQLSEIDVDDSVFVGGKLGVFKNSELSIEAGKTYEIEARLENGHRLNAYTSVPDKLELIYSPSDKKIDPFDEDEEIVRWETVDDNFKVMRAYIVYERPVDGETVRFKTEIPEKYIEKDGKKIPYFNKPSKVNSFLLDPEVIDNELRNIGNDIDKKFEIYIKYLTIDIIVYDINLSKYYESTSGDNSTTIINLDQAGYSNVTGGEGIFGSYNKQSATFLFDYEYIVSLGYTTRDDS